MDRCNDGRKRSQGTLEEVSSTSEYLNLILYTSEFHSLIYRSIYVHGAAPINIMILLRYWMLADVLVTTDNTGLEKCNSGSRPVHPFKENFHLLLQKRSLEIAYLNDSAVPKTMCRQRVHCNLQENPAVAGGLLELRD